MSARTWTEYTGKCRGCGRTFRVSTEAILEARDAGIKATDAEIAHAFEFCLRCATGEAVPEEYTEEQRRADDRAFFRIRLRAFVEAAHNLLAVWQETDASTGYPSCCLPSFDEFCNDLAIWREQEESR